MPHFVHLSFCPDSEPLFLPLTIFPLTNFLGFFAMSYLLLFDMGNIPYIIALSGLFCIDNGAELVDIGYNLVNNGENL
jgi:hypothetical protein